jgi:predicted nucleic acid-binding protein
MNNKVFIDSNIFIYLYSTDEPHKQDISQKVIEKYDCIISTQVLNEFCNVCLKKFHRSTEEIEAALNEISNHTTVTAIEENLIKLALKIQKQYKYSYFDCLMIASALDSGCSRLITEDLSDKQVIDKQVEIVNIFSRSELLKE